MKRNVRIQGVAAIASGAWLLVVCPGSSAAARDWYVKADAKSGGNGERTKPFNSTLQVEASSQPGDTIYILPSPPNHALDHGLQLRNWQRLIGLGPSVTDVTCADPSRPQATLTNTSAARYDGDIVRLAKNNVVRNIHFDHAFRASVLGVNSDGAKLQGNLITHDMSVHDLFSIEGPPPAVCGLQAGEPVCAGEWPNGYILFAGQTNHFAAITLVACGPNAREPRVDLLLQPVSYCEFLVPGSGSVSGSVDLQLEGNVIRDSNSDGITLISDTGAKTQTKLIDNVVRDLSLLLPDPSALGITSHVVRSRALTAITIDRSVSQLVVNDLVASNLAPAGSFASDGVVFLACGLEPVMSNVLSTLVIDNPELTGEAINGDSIEIQHRASTRGVIEVDIRDATLKDPANSNIKIIESAAPVNGVFDVRVRDSELSNINTAGTEDAQIRFFPVTPSTTAALWLSLEHVDISGLGRGLGLSVPVPPAIQAPNLNAVTSFRISVEDSSLSDLTGEAIVWSQAATAPLGGTTDPPIIDLGGGPLGSHGRNRFVHNGDPSFVPEGADPTGIDRVFSGDISVANARPAPGNPAIGVYAERNYWGGSAPVLSAAPGQGVYIPAGSNVTFSASRYLQRDPR